MQTLTYHMRCAVLNLARYNKRKARNSIQNYVHIAHNTLQGDELEEFLRDVVVLEHDVEHL